VPAPSQLDQTHWRQAARLAQKMQLAQTQKAQLVAQPWQMVQEQALAL
jgi:hypothetical protein